MEFIRENIAKILIFIGILIISIIIFSLIFGRGGATKKLSYSTMEDNLLNAATRYVKSNPKLLPKNEEESNKINLDTLMDSKYIKREMTAIEDENVKCTGYVELLYKNQKNIYVPYLKCGKYYETKTIADYIINNEETVVSGDGLYKYDDTYIFRGENPKNYLQLGDKLYRIMQIKEDGEVRLISNKKINYNFVWDDRYNASKDSTTGINNYTRSRLKDSFNYILDNNVLNPEDENYYFSSQEIDKMITHDICIGKRSTSYAAIDSTNECQVIEKDQKLSLITVSDYARTSVDPNCKTIFDKSCMNYNYLSQIGDTFRTVTAPIENTYQIYYIDEGYAQLTRASNSFRTNIVIYIDKLSLYNDGNGTLEKPYTVR